MYFLLFFTFLNITKYFLIIVLSEIVYKNVTDFQKIIVYTHLSLKNKVLLNLSLTFIIIIKIQLLSSKAMKL